LREARADSGGVDEADAALENVGDCEVGDVVVLEHGNILPSSWDKARTKKTFFNQGSLREIT